MVTQFLCLESLHIRGKSSSEWCDCDWLCLNDVDISIIAMYKFIYIYCCSNAERYGDG